MTLQGASQPVRLEPSSPPGRSSRKARAFALEILRLRDQGYSLAAIREALAEAGVRVSRSTVHREVMRPRPDRPAAGSPKLALSHQAFAELHNAATAQAGLTGDARSGRDIARDFVDGRITNPLIRAREHR